MLAKAVYQATLMSTDTASSRASPLPHLELRAPRQCTVNRNRARQSTQNPAFICKKTPIEKTRKPRNTGLSTFQRDILFQLVKTWHAPCNSPFSDSVHYPVSGTLVQAGRGFPSLHRAHTAQATSPSSFGALDTGRSGVPSLHRAHDAMREPRRFGNLGTGRPGIPSFIALGDGSPAASGHRPRYRPTRPAVAGPPPPSATTPHHSNARASSRSCR